MSLETNMDRVLERRQYIEGRLANAAALSSNQLMQLSRELAEIKPVAQQVEIVRQLQQSLQDAKDIAVIETAKVPLTKDELVVDLLDDPPDKTAD